MLIRITFILTFIFTCSPVAFSCSCTPSPPPAIAMQQATAVFTGKVIAISPSIGDKKRVVFKVDKAWKGVGGSFISVSTNANGASCGNSYSVGEQWLVYAHGTDNLSTSLCSRTSHLHNAQQDLQALGVSSTPSSVGFWVAFILAIGVVSSVSMLWFKKRNDRSH